MATNLPVLFSQRLSLELRSGKHSGIGVIRKVSILVVSCFYFRIHANKAHEDVILWQYGRFDH
jgi:hypothetical protein